MAVYFFGAMDIADRDMWNQYQDAAIPTIEPGGGELLFVDDDASLIEGEKPGGRVVALKFATRKMFDDWYNSAGYQDAMKFRLKGGKTNFLILADGPD